MTSGNAALFVRLASTVADTENDLAWLEMPKEALWLRRRAAIFAGTKVGMREYWALHSQRSFHSATVSAYIQLAFLNPQRSIHSLNTLQNGCK